MKHDVMRTSCKVDGTEESNAAFFQHMANAMSMSFFKYGPFRANYKGHYEPDFLDDVRSTLGGLLKRWENRPSTTAGGNALMFVLRRILGYVVTRNTEYMVDLANAAMIEFTCPQVAGAAFNPTNNPRDAFEGLSVKENADFVDGCGER